MTGMRKLETAFGDKMIKKVLFLLMLASGITVFIFVQHSEITQSKAAPPPTEIAENKANRKEKKRLRTEWMENMHRTAPDVDWKEMDIATRKNRVTKIMNQRRLLQENGELSDVLSRSERIGSRDISGVWNERGSNNLSGRIRTADISFENNTIYCASSGGQIWKGNLDGSEWVSLTDYIRIPGISFLRHVEFETHDRLFIGAGNGFYFTDDDGVTLTEATGLSYADDWGDAKRYILKMGANPVLYALAQEWDYDNWNSVVRIYRSTDMGISFSLFYQFDASLGNDNDYDIWTSRYSDSPVYALRNNEFYEVSETTLNLISTISTTSTGGTLLSGGFDGMNHFLFCRLGDQVFKSMDSGSSWSFMGTQPTSTFMVNSFNSSNIDPDILAIGQVDAYRSVDGGASWELINNWWEYYGNEATMLHADIPEIRWFIDPNGEEIILISTDGGLYKSYDNLETVENISLSGLGVSQYYSTLTKQFQPYSIFAGSQDQGFQRSLVDMEGVLDFEQSISGDYGHIVSGDSGSTLWTNYPGFTMYYPNPETDAWGLTLDFPGTGFLWLAPLAYEPGSPEIAYLGGGGISGGNHVIKLTVNGNSITPSEISQDFDSRVSAMAKSPITPATFYVLSEDGHFYWSHNNGLLTWDETQAFTGPGAHYFYGSDILPSSLEYGKVWICGSGYSNPGVYVSENHGESFVPLTTGLPNTMVYGLATNPDESLLFAATEVGPYMLDDSNEWSYMGELTAPDQVYWSVEYVSDLHIVRFGTYGRGIWDFEIEYDPCDVVGDFNADGTLNITDLVLLVQLVLNNDEGNEHEICTSDLDQNTQLDIFDILLLADQL